MPRRTLARAAVLTAVTSFFWIGLGGCPLFPQINGVTESQVKDLIAQTFNNFNDDLTLWKIQPGLGTVMIEYGRRFAMAQLAVKAGDWGMAQYQLEEALEIQEVGETTRAAKATLLKDFEHTYVDPLLEDIANKDATAFQQHLASAIGGCNDCHAATGHGYIVIREPTNSPEDFLMFAASEPAAAEEEEESTGAAKALAAQERALSWDELEQLVNDTFNNVDRTLTLWNIQPGLGTVMMEYGRRFAMLRFAADAGDWGMAQYQLKEAIEIQEVGETTRPNKATLLADFESTYLSPLEDAILAKDKDAFDQAYAAAINGCNDCHVATGHPFVRVQNPPTLPQPFLELAASEPSAPEEGEEHGSGDQAATQTHTGTPTQADAQALIEDKMNTIDRSLALWNIQPGLGTVMMEYGLRFALAWQAAQAGNWEMTEYQLDEALEIQEVGEVTRPAKASLLKAFENEHMDPLFDAIQARNLAQFQSAYNSAIDGCNSCHQATGHPYVRVRVPTADVADYLDMAAGAQ